MQLGSGGLDGANTAPVFGVEVNDRSNSAGEAITVFSLTASDEDEDTLVFTATNLPPGLSLDANTGEISGTLANDADSNSPYEVVITVDDQSGETNATASVQFTWVIGAKPNSAPVFTDTPNDRSNNAGDAVTPFTVAATDEDSNPLLYSVTNLPAGLIFNTTTAEISGTLANDADSNSPYEVVITVDDQSGETNATASVRFTWTIGPKPNSAPVFTGTPGNRSNIAGDAVTPFTVTATDEDANPLLYSVTNLPPGLSFDTSTGEISGSLANDADTNSPYRVEISVDDQTGEANATVVTAFDWVVTPIIYVSIDDISLIEGDAGVIQGALTVSLSQGTTRPIDVDFSTENLNAVGSGDANADYISTSGTITFPANGSATQSIVVEVLGDTNDEQDELFRVTLSNPVNARLQDNQGLITILNDDTRVFFETASQQVDESAGIINVTLQLEKTSALDVVVPYTFSGTATRDLDYQHAIIADEITIPANTLSTDLAITIINDAVNGLDETIILDINAPTYAKVGSVGTHTITIRDNDTSKLNDTGYTLCNDTVNLVGCPAAAYPGQDGDNGRDSFLTDDTDGHAGFGFTKLDSSGNVLARDATVFSCVRDNQTGLTWEVKTTSGLHATAYRYTWYNPDPATNGGSPGVQGTSSCGGANCDTHSLVEATNNEQLCGFSDWRMPSYIELQTIIDYSTQSPAIDTNFFPNTANTYYWTGDPHISSSLDAAKQYNFVSGAGFGDSSLSEKSVAKAVRLVRGGE